MQQISTWFARPWERLQRRFQQARPGSVLIMVVALLVLLALMGTAYIASARLERYSAVTTGGQRMLREAVESYAKELMDEAQTSLATDSGNTVTATKDDQTPYMAARSLMLLPDLTPAAVPAPAKPETPVWTSMSRPKVGQTFESPWKGPIGVQYQVDGGGFMGPTNVVIFYDGSDSTTDPALIGQTRTFPALAKYNTDPNDSSGRVWFQSNRPLPSGPWIAGDAMGLGIGDTPLRRLTASPVQGVDFYGGYRIVDNCDAFNLNTVLGADFDRDPNTGICYNFFPCDLDFLGALNATSGAAEFDAINERRWDTKSFADPYQSQRLDDKNPPKPHNDFTYYNTADAFWQQEGRRAGFPNGNARFGDMQANGAFVRPFADADTAALGWHGGLLNPGTPLSKIDAQLKKRIPNGTDSILAGAPNYFSDPRNQFRSFAANNVGYVFDWFWNFDNIRNSGGSIFALKFPIVDQNPAGLGKNMAKMVAPFRPLRSMVVGANPVANICTQINFPDIPAEAKNSGGNSVIDAGIHPHKASLNTSGFPELWRAFINVFGADRDPATGKVIFTVPGDPVPPQTNNNALLNQNNSILRNVVRGPNNGNTLNKNPAKGINAKTPGGGAGQADGLDSRNVLQLRAALAAVNVMTLREGHGFASGSGFIPAVNSAQVNLKTAGGTSVFVSCYGASPQPFITEVYASTDSSDHGGKQNNNGLVLIKLYNPYPFEINLTKYGFAVIDRRPSGTFPNMKTEFVDLQTTLTIAANDYILLTSYDGAAGNNYWPSYLDAAGAGKGVPPTAGPKVLFKPEIAKVLEGALVAGKQSNGSEFLLLRPDANGAPVVPVDCFDFAGLKLNQQKAMNWHYLREAGKQPDHRWRCVYPGDYDPTKTTSAGAGASYAPSRHEGVEIPVGGEYDPAAGDPWDIAPPLNPFMFNAAESDTASFPKATYNPIELCNLESAGFGRPSGGATARTFPFGGFARVGDVLQAPYVGAYVITTTQQTPGKFPDAIMEANPVTIDSTLVDDGDPADDAVEQPGRFIPIAFSNGTTPAFDDYSPWGYYGTSDPNPALHKPPTGVNKSLWRYHFAVQVLDQFTAVSNPESDLYPNMNQAAWGGTIAPQAVPNSLAAVAKPNTDNEWATEGLININTASWRILASMELVPLWLEQQNSGLNERLAKLIVYYRDVDDGLTRTDAKGNRFVQGHGAFKSLLELNKVVDPSSWDPGTSTYTRTFQNALGLLPMNSKDPNYNKNDPTYYQWGNFSPGPRFFDNKGKLKDPTADTRVLPEHDWMPQTLMVRRLSNLVTTRSDSFTVYVIVQGWRNAQSPYPELVVQKRLALIVDRSALGNTGGLNSSTMKTYNLPSD